MGLVVLGKLPIYGLVKRRLGLQLVGQRRLRREGEGRVSAAVWVSRGETYLAVIVKDESGVGLRLAWSQSVFFQLL